MSQTKEKNKTKADVAFYEDQEGLQSDDSFQELDECFGTLPQPQHTISGNHQQIVKSPDISSTHDAFLEPGRRGLSDPLKQERDRLNQQCKTLRRQCQNLLEKMEKIEAKSSHQNEQMQIICQQNSQLKSQLASLKKQFAEETIKREGLQQKLKGLQTKAKFRNQFAEEKIKTLQKFMERTLDTELGAADLEEIKEISQENIPHIRNINKKIVEICSQISEVKPGSRAQKKRSMEDRLMLLGKIQGYIFKQESRITAQREFISHIQQQLVQMEKKLQKNGSNLPQWLRPMINFWHSEQQLEKKSTTRSTMKEI